MERVKAMLCDCQNFDVVIKVYQFYFQVCQRFVF